MRRVLLVRGLSTSTRPFRRVGVIGAGLMGSGIAQVAADAGYAVTLCDVAPPALAKGVASIESSLKRVQAKAVSKGQVDEAGAARRVAETMARVDVRTSDVAALCASGCDLIVEAVVENLDLKRKLFAQLGKETPASVVLASNTSSFPIGEMAAASGRPAKVVGIHFFNPVPMMALVEVVSTTATDADSTQRTTDFVKSLGKTPVKCKDTPGFIVNRLLVPYLAEAMKMVDRGDAAPEDIDTAMKLGAGVPMGPLYLADYIGLDTCRNILAGWVRDYPEGGFVVPKSLDKLVSEGKLGRKSGQGYYPWPKA